MTISDLIDKTRPGLKPCPECGATWEKLRVHTWHVGCGANVWCSECSLGTPARERYELIVNNGDHEAVTKAAEIWNNQKLKSNP